MICILIIMFMIIISLSLTKVLPALSTTGIDVYNYVRDSAYINKNGVTTSCSPRRKNELTFKGDFWVNDTIL
jgi:hypothetical protein